MTAWVPRHPLTLSDTKPPETGGHTSVKKVLKPGEFDLERMQKALSGPSYMVPAGLSRAEFRQLIADVASGKR